MIKRTKLIVFGEGARAMVGNRVFGHVLILCMAFALLVTPWGSLPKTDPTIKPAIQNDLLAASLHFENPSDAMQTRLVSGWNGNVAIGGLLVPYWVIIGCLAMGSIIASLNWLEFTNLNSIVTFALFGMAAACSLVSIIHFAVAGDVGTGSVLAITSALAGLAISPSDRADVSAVIHKFDSSNQSQRRAA